MSEPNYHSHDMRTIASEGYLFGEAAKCQVCTSCGLRIVKYVATNDRVMENIKLYIKDGIIIKRTVNGK